MYLCISVFLYLCFVYLHIYVKQSHFNSKEISLKETLDPCGVHTLRDFIE